MINIYTILLFCLGIAITVEKAMTMAIESEYIR